MTDLSNTSIIIHYRKDSDDREFNLNTITKFLSENVNFKQLIIVNDDKSIDSGMFKFKNLDKICPVFIQNEDHFKKALAFNTARKMYATGDVLCFYDVDVLIEPQYLKIAQDKILRGDADHVYPFNGYFYNIKKSCFDQILDPLDFRKIDNLESEYVEFASDRSPGGCCLISTEAFDKIGGYDTNFIGWGFEDTDFFERSEEINRVEYLEEYDSICWHLEHSSAIRTENPHYENNLKTFIKNNRC